MTRLTTEGARRVIAGATSLADLLALASLVLAFVALDARGHARVGLDRAGAAGPRRGAARGRVEARLGCVALRGADQVGPNRVRALLARQRRARSKRTKVPQLAGDARLLTLISLVRADFAFVTLSHIRVWRDRARAARRLHSATGWRVVALDSRRAFHISFEVGCVRVRALSARQRRRRALRAVRAGRARPAHQLARRGLEGAGLALETRTHVCVKCDRAGAALGLLLAARRRKVARIGLRAPTDAGEVGGDGVRALLARQRRARAKRTVMASCARYRDSCCVIWAVEASRAESSTQG